MRKIVPARLADGPVFITNMSAVLSVALDLLHDVYRTGRSEEDMERVDKAVSLLTVANEACDRTVRDIEAGPDFKPIRMTGGARNG